MALHNNVKKNFRKSSSFLIIKYGKYFGDFWDTLYKSV